MRREAANAKTAAEATAVDKRPSSRSIEKPSAAESPRGKKNAQKQDSKGTMDAESKDAGSAVSEGEAKAEEEPSGATATPSDSESAATAASTSTALSAESAGTGAGAGAETGDGSFFYDDAEETYLQQPGQMEAGFGAQGAYANQGYDGAYGPFTFPFNLPVPCAVSTIHFISFAALLVHGH